MRGPNIVLPRDNKFRQLRKFSFFRMFLFVNKLQPIQQMIQMLSKRHKPQNLSRISSLIAKNVRAGLSGFRPCLFCIH